MPDTDLIQQNTQNGYVVMGLDFGIGKMGVALGNTLTQTARPLMQFPMKNGQPNWQNLLQLIVDWQVVKVIVGLPLNMDDTISEMGQRASKFSRRLRHQLQMQHIGCEVLLFDERLTSREAKNLAWEYGLIKRETDPIDAVAAAVLLQSWLFSQSSLTSSLTDVDG